MVKHKTRLVPKRWNVTWGAEVLIVVCVTAETAIRLARESYGATGTVCAALVQS